MDNDLPLVIIVGLFLLIPLGVVAYFAFFRTQASLLESLVMLIVGILPLGTGLTLLLRAGPDPKSIDLAKTIVGCAFPMILIFGGSVWGLSAAQRLGETDTLRRIMLLAAGWGLAFALLAIPSAGVTTLAVLSGVKFLRVATLILWSISILGVPGYCIEQRCKGLEKVIRFRSPKAQKS